MEPAGARALFAASPKPKQACLERPLTFFDLQLCSTPSRPPPTVHQPTASPPSSLTRCLVAVQLSTSLASATALVPATSPTNSNGNSDPSFLSPPPTQKPPVQSPVQSLGDSSILPAAIALASKCSLCINHRRVLPTVVPCLRPAPQAVPLPPFDRAVGDDRTLPNQNALGFAPGKSPVKRYPPGVATLPQRGDAIAESETSLIHFAWAF